MNVIGELRSLGLDDHEAVLAVSAVTEAGGRHWKESRSFELLKGNDVVASVELNAKYVVKTFAVSEEVWPAAKKAICEALARKKLIVARTTLLSYRELPGYARVDGWMLIRPLGYQLPDRTGLSLGGLRVSGGPPVPFSLEVVTEVVGLPFLDGHWQTRAVAQATWLLSAFLATPIFRVHAPYAFAMLEDGFTTVRCGTPALEGELRDDRFADVSGLSPLSMVDHDKYYGELGIASAQFEVPDLAELYSAYQSLTVTDQKRFLRACASVFEASQPGVSGVQQIVTLVGAIESLLEEGDRCHECKNHIGIAENFRTFVDAYVRPPDEIRKLYHDVYIARSELAHGAWHYEVNEPAFGITLKSDRVSLAAWSAAKRGVVNWLRNH